ncbi:MAG TPA: hypothetical protein PLY81_10015 [Chitinophagaceae bacterium]|nr:hypothetical protein [Chitinophagaceae bacterium]
MKNQLKTLTYILIILFSSHFSLLSQEQSAVSELLNRNEVAIYKAQKEMIAHNAKTNIDKLALSVTLQVKAIDTYKKGSLNEASNYAIASRENALLILKDLLDVKQLAYFELDNSEKNIVKTINYNPSTLNNKVEAYNEAILLDPIKIRETYNISINQ